jgi:hypothetical protein
MSEPPIRVFAALGAGDGGNLFRHGNPRLFRFTPSVEAKLAAQQGKPIIFLDSPGNSRPGEENFSRPPEYRVRQAFQPDFVLFTVRLESLSCLLSGWKA